MKYIFVTGSYQDKRKNEVLNCCARQSGAVLFSLIKGFKSKRFGIDTLENVADELNLLKKNVLEKHDAKLIIDSGGYSIIKGEVEPEDVPKFTQIYHYFLKHFRDNFDRIFSLDIPINLAWNSFNTVATIRSLNRVSIEKSLKVLEAYPEIFGKFYFVNHFKIEQQHRIWRDLINEFDLNKIIKNRSIGGLVSTREIAKLKFSPIIGPFYQLLHDYLSSSYQDEFRVHFLGVYNIVDRFVITLLELLTAQYLPSAKIDFSYDTIYFFRNATKNIRHQKLYLIDKDLNLEIVPINGITESVVDGIYYNHFMKSFFYKNLEQRKAKKKMDDVSAFAPINIHNELLVDKLLKDLILKYNLHDSFNIKLHSKFEKKWKQFRSDITEKYESLFESKHLEELSTNANKIFEFHKWYKAGGSQDILDVMMTNFIREIGFPADLS